MTVSLKVIGRRNHALKELQPFNYSIVIRLTIKIDHKVKSDGRNSQIQH